MGNLQNADKTKDHPVHGLLFCWIPAGGAERPQCGNKRGVSPVSNERCKRRRSSATIANCNTYSPARFAVVVLRRRRSGFLELRCLPFLRGAYSATGSAPLRHVASQALRANWLEYGRISNLQNADKTKDHAVHGLLFCWIPAATYSPGPSPVKYHRRMKA